MKYVVRTSGGLLAGFEIDEVRAELQRRLSMPAHQAAKLVSGRSLRVVTTPDRAKATKLAKSLSACGLEVRLDEAPDDATQPAPAAAAGPKTDHGVVTGRAATQAGAESAPPSAPPRSAPAPAEEQTPRPTTAAAESLEGAPVSGRATPPATALFHPAVPAALGVAFFVALQLGWGWASLALWIIPAVWMGFDAVRLKQRRIARGSPLTVTWTIVLLGLVPAFGPLLYAGYRVFEGFPAGATELRDTSQSIDAEHDATSAVSEREHAESESESGDEPSSSDLKPSEALSFLTGVIIVGAIFVWFGRDDGDPASSGGSTAGGDDAGIWESISSEAIRGAETVLESTLRAPGTYSRNDWSTLWSGRDLKGRKAYIVEVSYDAQNGFGAYIRGCSWVAFSIDGSSVFWDQAFAVNECYSSSEARGMFDRASYLEFIRAQFERES
jgi:hypothetical protein